MLFEKWSWQKSGRVCDKASDYIPEYLIPHMKRFIAQDKEMHSGSLQHVEFIEEPEFLDYHSK